MEPQHRQHIWFWLAAACLVGSVMSLRTHSYNVVENAIEATPTKLTGPVYRSRSALPTQTESVLQLSPEPEMVQQADEKETQSRPPLLLPSQSTLEVTRPAEQLIQDKENILTTNFEDHSAPEAAPSIPESIWLSGSIELTE